MKEKEYWKGAMSLISAEALRRWMMMKKIVWYQIVYWRRFHRNVKSMIYFWIFLLIYVKLRKFDSRIMYLGNVCIMNHWPEWVAPFSRLTEQFSNKQYGIFWFSIHLSDHVWVLMLGPAIEHTTQSSMFAGKDIFFRALNLRNRNLIWEVGFERQFNYFLILGLWNHPAQFHCWFVEKRQRAHSPRQKRTNPQTPEKEEDWDHMNEFIEKKKPKSSYEFRPACLYLIVFVFQFPFQNFHTWFQINTIRKRISHLHMFHHKPFSSNFPLSIDYDTRK